MSRRVLVPSKRTEEVTWIDFPFGDQLLFGETISGMATQCSVFTGDDSNPSAILGPSELNGTVVRQQVLGGLPGVIYQLTCLVTGSEGHVYSKGARLAVVDDPDTFIGA